MKIEQNMHKSQQQFGSSPEQSQQQSSRQMKNMRKGEKRIDKQRACATSINSDESWKDSLLKKIRDLEIAQQAAEANTKEIAAENDALSKEFGRLRHLEQIRSVPAPTDHPPSRQRNTIQSGNCFNKFYKYGESGHFVRNCPRSRVQSNSGAEFHSDSGQHLQVKGASGIPSRSLDAYLRVSITNNAYDCLLDQWFLTWGPGTPWGSQMPILGVPHANLEYEQINPNIFASHSLRVAFVYTLRNTLRTLYFHAS